MAGGKVVAVREGGNASRFLRLIALCRTVVLAALTAATSGCGTESTGPNDPPRILWVRAEPDTVGPGGTSVLSCLAEDPQGEPVSYGWFARDGLFPQGAYASQVLWEAPSVRGEYKVSVQVTDGSNHVGSQIGLWVLEDRPVLGVDPDVLSFGRADDALILEVFNAGRDTLTWSVSIDSSWVGASSAEGVSTGAPVPITVSVDRAGLASGYRHALLTVESNGGTAKVPVVVWVVAEAALVVEPAVLDFGDGLTTAQLTLSNAGVGSLSWQASAAEADTSWISVVPAEGGLGPGGTTFLEVTISRAGAPPGERVGALWLESDGGGATVAIRAQITVAGSP